MTSGGRWPALCPQGLPPNQDPSGILEPSTRYLEGRPRPHSPGRGRKEASRVLGKTGGHQPCIVQKAFTACSPREGGLRSPATQLQLHPRAVRRAVSMRPQGRLSWPRTSGYPGSCGSCPPAAPRCPRPWPELPSGRPGWWQSRRGCCSCGAPGRPAA